MKKYYLPFIALGLFSGTVFSQNTFVTGTAKVKVQPGTLFYHGGNFTVKAAASPDATIVNDGNIRINGSFANEVPNGKNFLNTYNQSNGNYGQVIINSTTETPLNGTQNRLTMQKMSINPGTSDWGQFAIPYRFATVKEAFETLFSEGIETVNYQAGNRYNHSVMTWDNITRPEYDHIAPTVAINPTDYVILNLINHPQLNEFMEDGTRLMFYSGRPTNAPYSVPFRPALYAETSVPWDVWKLRRNIYGEQYQTYIEDYRSDVVSPDFGRYLFQFGNPYTSNIDLSRIGRDGDADGVYVENLNGVFKASNNSWTADEGGDIGNATYLRATYDSGSNTWAGNAEALIVKPFEGFYIGLSSTSTNRSDRNFTFNNGLKTFSNGPSNSAGSLSKMGGEFQDTEDMVTEDGRISPNSYLIANNATTRTTFYQLGLNLYTENDQPTGNTVYVVVDTYSENGVDEILEAEYSDFNRGFFLAQENADGTEVTTSSRKMQINAIHPRFVSKPIPLFFSTPSNDINGYYVKADLFYRSIFNKLNTEDVNFVDGNSFFFYDKAQDILLPITTDFSYYIERPDEVPSNRYVVYWNGGPQENTEKLGVSDELAGLTQVYKDGNVHKIRFNDSWSTADVMVYDLTGRSIFRKEGVKTDVDFTLDLPNTSAYVVKIQSNTGEVVTQKILR